MQGTKIRPAPVATSPAERSQQLSYEECSWEETMPSKTVTASSPWNCLREEEELVKWAATAAASDLASQQVRLCTHLSPGETRECSAACWQLPLAQQIEKTAEGSEAAAAAVAAELNGQL